MNADLKRQFEFVQQNWINNPAFAGLSNERDPLIGDHPHDGLIGYQSKDVDDGEFTIAALPAPNRLRGLRRFVTVKGGQYFFLPGLRALARMCQ